MRTLRRLAPLAVLGPLVLLSLQMALALARLHLPAGAVTSQGNLQPDFQKFLYTRVTYSDILTEYSIHGLFSHPVPYVDVGIEYPVLTGLFMGLAGAFHGVHTYLVANSIALWGCGVGCVAVLWSLSHRAAWWFAASPLVLLFSLMNWDLFGILLMVLGWRAYVRGRFGWSGLWLGLGVFAKLFPIFLLGCCFLALVRRCRAGEVERRGLLAFVTTALVTSVAVNLPFALANRTNWAEFYVFNIKRRSTSGLLNRFTALGHASSTAGDLVLGLVLVALAVGCAVVVLRGASPVTVAAIGFAGFLLFTKVYDPQYVLWLLAYALLARWPAWALCLLVAEGVLDFANAVVILDLKAWDLSGTSWYGSRIWPLGIDLRLIVIAIAAIGAAIEGRLKRGGPEPALPAATGAGLGAPG